MFSAVVPLASSIYILYGLALGCRYQQVNQSLAHCYRSLGDGAKQNAVSYCLELVSARVEASSDNLIVTSSDDRVVGSCGDDSVCRVLVGAVQCKDVLLAKQSVYVCQRKVGSNACRYADVDDNLRVNRLPRR